MALEGVLDDLDVVLDDLVEDVVANRDHYVVGILDCRLSRSTRPRG